MQGLEGHCFRFTSDELFNGLPAQLVDKWSAWGVHAAVGAEGIKIFACLLLKCKQLLLSS